MSHDSEAAFASGEVAGIIQRNANQFFGSLTAGGIWTLCSGREGSAAWPLADGVIKAENSKKTVAAVNIAFEYKRQNEGVHGMLTALGQSLAYVEKGYDASVVCIPKRYSSHNAPGEHLKRIIEATAPNAPIAVYVYDAPNMADIRPFLGKIECVRDIDLSKTTVPRKAGGKKISGQISTVWAHVREGMSHPDAFFRYCQAVKVVSSVGERRTDYKLPNEPIEAVKCIDSDADPILYLSNTVGDALKDKTWRYVWYHYYFRDEQIPIFKSRSPYTVNDSETMIRINENQNQRLFSGRKDSIKNKIVDKLNADSNYTENEAWEDYVKKVRKDAHSYREVIDSGLFQLGLIDADGFLTNHGFKYVSACEKAGNNPYAEEPMNILRAVSLQIGQYDVFLYTAHKYSRKRFAAYFDDFTRKRGGNEPEFQATDYLEWLNEVLTNQLHMYRKSTTRAGGTRKPFQAEMSYLKKLGFVYQDESFRRGIGLNIDWPLVESSLVFFNSL
ncbi:MAG: hypothetical protein Q4A32_00390 [Lachnospiraceae bacterium]|nr:hypothetical protein [Lachnospiraceae bacterium]